MIIIFHQIYFITKFLLKYYRRRTVLREFLQNFKDCQELSAAEAASTNNEIRLESLAVLKFDPPVYLERYCDVQEILLDLRWGSEMAKVVEFGCAELKLFTYLKRLLYVREILHVDIDEELLKDSLFRIEPLTVDHLVQRSQPLLVQVLAGSVSDPDYRLRGADAVIAIELIEHLYPDTLEALPYNIFSYIRPKIVIFTTPNADFNVLFPNFSGMRHYDHKFEWTRSQFQDWCSHIIKRFPQYSVSFQGCGSGPIGSEHLGFCSQMAVFTKHYNCVENEVPNECCNIISPNKVSLETKGCDADISYGICTYYSYSKVLEKLSTGSLAIIESSTTAIEEGENLKVSSESSLVAQQDFYRLIHKIDYPYYPDSRTPIEIKLDEARYKIHQARIYRVRYYVEELNRLEIPVYDLIFNNQGPFSTVVEMSKLLVDAGFTLEQCVCDGSGQPASCVIQYLDMDCSGRTSSVSELSDPPAADDDDPNGATRCPTARKQLDHWKSLGSDEEESWDNNAALLVKDDPNALSTSRLHLGAITATLTNITDQNTINSDSKPSPGQNSDQLIDSGYQKSITSTAEWSPQSPLQDGMFEEQFNSCGGRSPVDVTDGLTAQDDGRSPAQKKTFTCAVGRDGVGMVCSTPGPEPGTSAANGKKMKKDVKDASGTRKKSRSKVHDLAEEDVRELTQCLILNSLNRIPLEECPLVQSLDTSSPVSAGELQSIYPISEKSQSQSQQDDVQPAEPDEVINVDDLRVIDVPIEVAPLQQPGGVAGILLEPPLEVDGLVGGGVVENGDLANNNRDLEGNNYPDIEMGNGNIQADIRDIHELEDNLNENIENNVDVAIAIGFPIIVQPDNHLVELELANHNQDVANRNNVQNMPELLQPPHHQQQQQQQQQQEVLALVPALIQVNDLEVEEINVADQQLHGIRLAPPVPPSSLNAIDLESEPLHSRLRLLHPREHVGGISCGISHSSDSPELIAVHRASHEALFDSDSQIDLLDDLPLPEVGHVYEHIDEDVDEHRPRNIVLVGVNNYDEGMEDPFPHWLLQLLGDDGDQHDEPHFYCQGDGVGVHPSIVEVDIEDDEQSTSSSSADTSSVEDIAAAAATIAATITVNMDEVEQPISLPSSSTGTLNDALDLVAGQNGLEVIGLSVHPRIYVDYLPPPNPPPSSVATTPLDAISPRTSLANILTITSTNLLDLNISNITDRDSSDDMFYDTAEDLSLTAGNETADQPQNQIASVLNIENTFDCSDANSSMSSEAGSKTSYH